MVNHLLVGSYRSTNIQSSEELHLLLDSFQNIDLAAHFDFHLLLQQLSYEPYTETVLTFLPHFASSKGFPLFVVSL